MKHISDSKLNRLRPNHFKKSPPSIAEGIALHLTWLGDVPRGRRRYISSPPKMMMEATSRDVAYEFLMVSRSDLG